MVKQRKENTLLILVSKCCWENNGMHTFSSLLEVMLCIGNGNCSLRTLLWSSCKTQCSGVILMSAPLSEWCTRYALYTFRNLHWKGMQIQSYFHDTAWDRCHVTIISGNFLLDFHWKLCLQRIYKSNNYYLCISYAW